MNEQLEQLIGFAKSAWRFRAIGLLGAWVVCLGGWAFVGMLEDTYEAAAVVYVNTTSELRDLLDDQIIESSMENKLRFVRQAILGTEQLNQVAYKANLILGSSGDSESQHLVEQLRDDIVITSANDTRRRTRPNEEFTDNTYTITFQYSDRKVAVAVVEALLNGFQEDLIQAKVEQSAGTGEFLREQIHENEGRLRRAEEDLAAFNRENFDRLPSLQGGYFRQLQLESTELETARGELNLAKKRLESLESQLAGESPVLLGAEVDSASLEGRIRTNQVRLDELKLRFTDAHPDVVAAKENFALLQQQYAEQMAKLETGDAVAISSNPVYQAIRISKSEAETEIARLQADVEIRERRLSRLQNLIHEVPEVEAELAQLNRDYEVVNDQHQTLLNRLEKERLSREVGIREQVDFRVISPPTAGEKPIAPKRPIFLSIVLAAGIAMAGGIALILGHMKPVFTSFSDLSLLTDIPLLGTIGHLATDSERRRRALADIQFALSVAGLFMVFGTVVYVDVFGPGLRNILLD